MSILALIPARFASTRFPGKPLVNIAGKTMIQRVYEQTAKAKRIAAVYVATDDERIANEVRNFGGQVIMTSDQHRSGTDRCAEALEKIQGNWKAVINIQGDEPFIQPEQIDLLANLFDDAKTEIGTLVKKLTDPTDLDNPNTIKVVLDQEKNGLYFSRSPIPHLRGVNRDAWLAQHLFYKHIGIYGYRSDILPKLTQLAPGILEQAESLEQLRWRENGFTIQTAFTSLETISIDAPEDLEKLQKAGLV
ncbi:MAG: 3-deoxy-manno-octulosonate cytidylyltransferase [Bacteroidia bacterium]